MKNSNSSPERWDRIERLFKGALDEEPGERQAFIERECEGDVALRDEVLRLLRAHAISGGFLAGLDTQHAAALLKSTPTREPDHPTTIGPYRVISPLARGGMGIVYLAADDRLARRVALKCLPSWLRADPSSRERFIAEARMASTIRTSRPCTTLATHRMAVFSLPWPTTKARRWRSVLHACP